LDFVEIAKTGGDAGDDFLGVQRLVRRVETVVFVDINDDGPAEGVIVPDAFVAFGSPLCLLAGFI
jgi:hypothetical protein